MNILAMYEDYNAKKFLFLLVLRFFKLDYEEAIDNSG